MNIGVVIVSIIIFIITIIIMIIIALKYMRICGNKLYHIVDITKCCLIRITNENWGPNKLFSKNGKEEGLNDNNKIVTSLEFFYEGKLPYKDIKLDIRLYHKDLGKNYKNYVLASNASHAHWSINANRRGVMDIESTNLLKNMGKDKNGQYVFTIYPALPHNTKVDAVYASKA